MRFAWKSFVQKRFAPKRSGRILGFASRHAFQAATSCFSNATCSSFAMRAPRIVVLRPTIAQSIAALPKDKRGYGSAAVS
jgi:hypothetical protein